MANKPLQGKRILVTRAKEQNADFVQQLAALGAVPVELPTIQTVLPTDLKPLDEAIVQLAQVDWLIFTSVNGVRFFWERFQAANRLVEQIAHCHIAAVGPKTAAAIEAYGLAVDQIPEQYLAEGLLDSLPDMSGQHILLPTADIAHPILEEGLRQKGAIVERVTAYQTVVAPAPADLAARLAAIDIATFTSASTVQNLFAMIAPAQAEKLRQQVTIACLGPKTAQAAQALGLAVHIVPQEYTLSGLIAALSAYVLQERSPDQ